MRQLSTWAPPVLDRHGTATPTRVFLIRHDSAPGQPVTRGVRPPARRMPRPVASLARPASCRTGGVEGSRRTSSCFTHSGAAPVLEHRDRCLGRCHC